MEILDFLEKNFGVLNKGRSEVLRRWRKAVFILFLLFYYYYFLYAWPHLYTDCLPPGNSTPLWVLEPRNGRKAASVVKKTKDEERNQEGEGEKKDEGGGGKGSGGGSEKKDKPDDSEKKDKEGGGRAGEKKDKTCGELRKMGANKVYGGWFMYGPGTCAEAVLDKPKQEEWLLAAVH